MGLQIVLDQHLILRGVCRPRKKANVILKSRVIRCRFEVNTPIFIAAPLNPIWNQMSMVNQVSRQSGTHESPSGSANVIIVREMLFWSAGSTRRTLMRSVGLRSKNSVRHE